MRFLLLLPFILLLLLTISVLAQENDGDSSINLDNINQLEEIVVLGEPQRASQFTHLEFSPDDNYLVYDTTFQTAASRLEGNLNRYKNLQFWKVQFKDS